MDYYNNLMLYQMLILNMISMMVMGDAFFYIKKPDDGYFLPHLKEKGVGKLIGEDSFATSPYVIAVADGVGANAFPANHISRRLSHHSVLQFTENIIYCKNPVNEWDCSQADMDGHKLFDHLFINVAIIKHNRQIEDFLATKLDVKFPRAVSFDDTASTTTFVSAYLSDTITIKDSIGTLRIYQKGDSLSMVLRYDPVAQNWKPYMYSSEHQWDFNSPYQFSSEMEENDGIDISWKMGAKNFDIVFLASDGIFDNMPFPMAVFLFNFLMKKIFSYEPGKHGLNPEVVLNSFADLWIKIDKAKKEEMTPKMKESKKPKAEDANRQKLKVNPCKTDFEIHAEFERLFEKDVSLVDMYRELITLEGGLWDESRTKKLLDPSIVDMIDGFFKFDPEKVKKIAEYYDPTFMAKSITNFVKYYVKNHRLGFSMYWLHLIEAPGKQDEYIRCKDDDMTLVTGLILSPKTAGTYSPLDAAKTVVTGLKKIIEEDLADLHADLDFMRTGKDPNEVQKEVKDDKLI